MKKVLVFLLFWTAVASLAGQASVNIQGYTYAANNSGYIGQVEISLAENGVESPDFFPTDSSGKFVLQLPEGHDFELIARKNGFKEVRVPASTKGKSQGEYIYLKFPMERLPGYILEGTISEIFVNNAPPGEKADKSQEVNAINGATIELYNNTTHEEVYRSVNHPKHTFSCRLEQGNEYTMLIRKEGFYNKRSKIYVNIKGCILCFEGVGSITPGVVDNLTRENTMGVLGANITMRRIKIGEGVKLDNIYYDVGKWDIRPDAKVPLDNLVRVLKENPSIVIELQSHTDSRNSFNYNMELSQKRAQAAVDYMESKGIGIERMRARGYGESLLKNKCKDDVPCSEQEHQENRRTEFAVIEFKSDPYQGRSLRSIIADEETEEYVKLLSTSYFEAPIQPDSGAILASVPTDSVAAGGLSILKFQDPQPVAERGPEPTEVAAIEVDTLPSEASILATTDTALVAWDSLDVSEGAAPDKAALAAGTPEPAPKTELPKPVVEAAEPLKNAVPEYVVRETPPAVLRKARAVPAGFTGFMVELLNSPAELPAAHSIYNEFGKVFLDKDLDGHYSYMVGEVPKKAQAEAFVKQVLSGRFPGARIVEYANGARK